MHIMVGFVYIYIYKCSTFTLPETQKMNFSNKVEAREDRDVARVAGMVSNRDRATISSVASVLRIWLKFST